MAQAQYTNHRRQRVALGEPHRATGCQRDQLQLQCSDRRQRHGALVPGERHRRHDRRNRGPGRDASTPTARTPSIASCPALAVDRAGDMAVGYTKSNATTNPQIKYAGRLAGDPVNTFSQTEQTLIDGTGSQAGNCGSSTCIRWGDYSGMALDPERLLILDDGRVLPGEWAQPPHTHRFVPIPGLHHRRQRNALRDRDGRLEHHRRRRCPAWRSHDHNGWERPLLVHGSFGTVSLPQREQGRVRLRLRCNRHRPRRRDDHSRLRALRLISERVLHGQHTGRVPAWRPERLQPDHEPGQRCAGEPRQHRRQEHERQPDRLRLLEHKLGGSDGHADGDRAAQARRRRALLCVVHCK